MFKRRYVILAMVLATTVLGSCTGQGITTQVRVNSPTNAAIGEPTTKYVNSEDKHINSEVTPLPDDSFSLKVGDAKIEALINKGKPTKKLFFNMHDDENTAVEAAKDIVRINGGTLVELQHGGERLISFNLFGKPYKFDPNRIFTPTGISKTLLMYGQTSPAAEKEVYAFAKELIERFMTGFDVVVGMHNNTNGGYSAVSYVKGGEYEKDGAQVFINPEQDPDDFFYVVEENHFNALKAKGYNVVLQNNESVTDDGSLSVYCGRQKITYINVEAEHGHLKEQEKMLTDLLDVLGK